MCGSCLFHLNSFWLVCYGCAFTSEENGTEHHGTPSLFASSREFQNGTWGWSPQSWGGSFVHVGKVLCPPGERWKKNQKGSNVISSWPVVQRESSPRTRDPSPYPSFPKTNCRGAQVVLFILTGVTCKANFTSCCTRSTRRTLRAHILFTL